MSFSSCGRNVQLVASPSDANSVEPGSYSFARVYARSRDDDQFSRHLDRGLPAYIAGQLRARAALAGIRWLVKDTAAEET